MTLAIVQAEALRRVAGARLILQTIRAHEVTHGGDDASRGMKGMLFVQNYAAYEYVVVETVRALVADLNARAIPHAALRSQLLGLALDAEFASVIDGSLAKTWAQRADLSLKARSTQAATVPENLLPKDGTHFRCAQLETIWSTFGLALPVLPSGRLRSHVEEMVEKRNAIAHGREAPDVVGGGFTISDMDTRVVDTEVVLSHIIDSAVVHTRSPGAFL